MAVPYTPETLASLRSHALVLQGLLKKAKRRGSIAKLALGDNRLIHSTIKAVNLLTEHKPLGSQPKSTPTDAVIEARLQVFGQHKLLETLCQLAQLAVSELNVASLLAVQVDCPATQLSPEGLVAY